VYRRRVCLVSTHIFVPECVLHIISRIYAETRNEARAIIYISLYPKAREATLYPHSRVFAESMGGLTREDALWATIGAVLISYREFRNPTKKKKKRGMHMIVRTYECLDTYIAPFVVHFLFLFFWSHTHCSSPPPVFSFFSLGKSPMIWPGIEDMHVCVLNLEYTVYSCIRENML